MAHSFKVLGEAAAAVLVQLADGLAVGDSRKIDRGAGFMPVHVECLQQTNFGALYSVAHYYKNDGDLVPDPDVVFVRTPEGWTPVSFQDSTAYRVAVTIHGDGTVEVDEREHQSLLEFCEGWLRNIQEQQALLSTRGTP